MEENIKNDEQVEDVEKNKQENESQEHQEQEVNPFFDYLQKVFSKEKTDEFIEKLTPEQNKFIMPFVSGFQSALGRPIIGVYDYSYIEGFHFTKEILDAVHILIRSIEVTDLNIKFVIVAQY